MNEIGVADRQEVGPQLNNRAENSHQPFRRRERAMQRFRSKRTLQKFSSAHVQVHNHFNQERHLLQQVPREACLRQSKTKRLVCEKWREFPIGGGDFLCRHGNRRSSADARVPARQHRPGIETQTV